MTQPLRGMKDILPEEQARFRFIVDCSFHIASYFGYQEIATPILEPSEVFEKTLGAGSDVVEKETYHFVDQGGRSVTLRPEATASLVRAVISKKLYHNQPLRFFYSGPMFRYERPQKARFRQFHQAGVEIFGEPSALAEAELIEMARMILKKLKILPQTALIINTIGDNESQKAYREKLISYLEPYKKDLSQDSQKRLSKNPLRILDSKNKEDQKILQNAPQIKSALNKKSKLFYDEVVSALAKRGIDFTKKEQLVRGLDYYNHTVFEYISENLGAKSAVLAGGRYNNLMKNMGGADVPAAGWAFGVERMALLCDDFPNFPRPIGILSTGEGLEENVFKIAHQLRSENFPVWTADAKQPFSKQLKAANKKNCCYVLILGSKEWQKDQIGLKNMETGVQKNITKKDIISVCRSFFTPKKES